LISAWMPAPPLESLPAMVNAVFICHNFLCIKIKDADMPVKTCPHLWCSKLQRYFPTLA
jgi:hypothetical protein